MEKISPPIGFDSRTAQPLASRYTDSLIIIIIIIIIVVVVVVVVVVAIELSLGDSSPCSSADKANKNKYT